MGCPFFVDRLTIRTRLDDQISDLFQDSHGLAREMPVQQPTPQGV
jgi:hypothetical protein